MKKIVFCLVASFWASGMIFAQATDSNLKITNKFSTSLAGSGFADDQFKVGLYDAINSKKAFGRWDLDISYMKNGWGLNLGLRTQGSEVSSLGYIAPRLNYAYGLRDDKIAKILIGWIFSNVWSTQNDNRGWGWFSTSTLMSRPGAIVNLTPMEGLNIGGGMITHLYIPTSIIDDYSSEGLNTGKNDMGINGLVAGLSYELPFGLQVAAGGKWTKPEVEAYAGLSYHDSMNMLTVGVSGYGDYLNQFDEKGSFEINTKIALDGTQSRLPLKAELKGYYHAFGQKQSPFDSKGTAIDGPSSYKIALMVASPMPVDGGIVFMPALSVNYATYRYIEEALGGKVDTFPASTTDLTANGITPDISSIGADLSVTMAVETNRLTLGYCPTYILSEKKPLGRANDSSPLYHKVALGYSVSF